MCTKWNGLGFFIKIFLLFYLLDCFFFSSFFRLNIYLLLCASCSIHRDSQEIKHSDPNSMPFWFDQIAFITRRETYGTQWRSRYFVKTHWIVLMRFGSRFHALTACGFVQSLVHPLDDGPRKPSLATKPLSAVTTPSTSWAPACNIT